MLKRSCATTRITTQSHTRTDARSRTFRARTRRVRACTRARAVLASRCKHTHFASPSIVVAATQLENTMIHQGPEVRRSAAMCHAPFS
eukprot:6178491-Pleurochrysis_carterae.AAC.1